jgi:hypothetical protein
VVTGHELKTIRTVSATLSVYDLQQRKRVLLATIEGKEETKRDIAKAEDIDVGGVLGKIIDTVEVIDEIFGDGKTVDYGDFPEPPKLKDVMMHIYKRFADELPKD